MLPPVTLTAFWMSRQPTSSGASPKVRSTGESLPVWLSGTFEKLAVSGSPGGGGATVAEGLLPKGTGLSSSEQTAPSPAGPVAGERDRHRVVAGRDQPAVVAAVDERGSGHVGVVDRERVVAQRGRGDRDLVGEDAVEGEGVATVPTSRGPTRRTGPSDGLGARAPTWCAAGPKAMGAKSRTGTRTTRT